MRRSAEADLRCAARASKGGGPGGAENAWARPRMFILGGSVGFADRAHSGRRTGLPNPQRLELAVQGRALHADELGSARDIAAEPADLGAQVFALEHLPGLAQR